MTYVFSPALQEAVYGALTADAELAAEVGSAIHDATPEGPAPETYVVLGEEIVRDRSDMTGCGALHRMTVSVVTTQESFARAKRVAAAVTRALHCKDLTLAEGRLVYLRFDRARARRTRRGEIRRIDLRFDARIGDS